MAEGDGMTDRERAAAERRAAHDRRIADRRVRLAERTRRRDADRAATRAGTGLRGELAEVYRRRGGPGRDGGAAAGEGSLHWMVPARRAVVRDVLTYSELVDLWIADLRRHLPALATWYYDCSSASEKRLAVQQLLDSLDAVDSWRDRTIAHVAVEGSHVIDHRGFKVRLWKGPLRVLQEQRAAATGHAGTDEEADAADDEHADESGTASGAPPPPPAAATTATTPPPAPTATPTPDPEDPQPAEGEDEPDPGRMLDNLDADPEQIDEHEPSLDGSVRPGARHHQPPFQLAIARRGPQQDVRLVLNDFGEVDPDGTTVFLPGDVVEFPVWKLLRHPEHHAAYARVEFNPTGSFLLGTSVRVRNQAVSPPPDAPLHDNLIAMRFQGLMNAARGAFYRLGRVFNGFQDEAPKLELGRTTVCARGLMYAGTLQPHNVGASARTWGIQNSHWGVCQGGTTMAKNLPNTTALATLAANRLTPGWTCTPSQGYTMMYMRNALAEGSMRDSPGQEVTYPGSSWLNDVDVTVGQWFPALERTVNEWAKLIWDRHQTAGLVAPTAAPAEPSVPEPPPAVPAPPDAAAPAADVVSQYVAAIDAQLRRQREVPERRRALEERARYHVIAGRLRDQETRARKLAEAAAADEAEAASPARARSGSDEEPTWEEQITASRQRIVPAEPSPSRDDLARVETDLRDITVRLVLSSSADRAIREKGLYDLQLEYNDAVHPPVGNAPASVNGFIGVDIDADNAFWQQYNVVVMGSHTFGVVRMRRSDTLCDHASPSPRKPPQVGFLTSYEPLSGVPHVGIPHSATGVAPEEEMYTFESGGALARSPGHGFFGSAPHHVKLVRQVRMRLHGTGARPQTLHIDNLPMDAGSDGRPARLNAILRLRDDRLAAIHQARLDEHRGFEPIGFGDKHHGFLAATHPLDLYAVRAVPFPAFEEGASAPFGDEVMPNIQASRDWMTEIRPGILRSMGWQAVPEGSDPPEFLDPPAGPEPLRQRWNAMFNQSRRPRGGDPHGA